MEDNSKSKKRLVVVGGGAAGFFCAVNAARFDPSLQIIILEKSAKLLSKVRISGGGRCNVTHACFDIAEMSKRYPRGGNFVKKSFHYFFTNDTIDWFKVRGVVLKTEDDGRMFPVTDSSQTIIDCLLREASKFNVQVRTNCSVNRLSQSKTGFEIETSEGTFHADFVCIACGGFPKLSMFDWITALGHKVSEPVPSLFTFNMPSHPITRLMGISVETARVKIQGTRLDETGALLITHWGMSGPVILRLSAWGARELHKANWSFKVMINWIPQHHEQSTREILIQQRTTQASQKISSKNSFGLPARLWDFLIQESTVKDDQRWGDISNSQLNMLVKNLVMYHCEVRGKTTYKEEFVTAGGIDLSEVDPNTMMSRKVPNLYFAGEVLDVDGITGGFNFQHAWTSGFIAAQAISHRP